MEHDRGDVALVPLSQCVCEQKSDHLDSLMKSILQFPNPVDLSTIGRKCAQKSASERKRAQTQKSAKERKRVQKGAKERFRVKIANNQV